MIPLFHFIRLAVNNLLRGGQRILVALLCIAFGVMALVGMSMLATSIESAVLLTPAQRLGGDLSIGRNDEDFLRPVDVDQLQALLQAGEISRYTLIAYNGSSLMLHAAGSGEMHFIGTAMGVEPERYPLAGSLTVGEPGGIGLATLLQQVGDVILTRDLAGEYNFKIGDPIVLSDLRVGIPVAGVVRGIAYDTPNHQGDKIYYSVETAQMLANGQPVVNTAMVNTDQPRTMVTELENSGWGVNWPAGQGDSDAANVWIIGLHGAGILGLLVGGVGIANTMQVLLRRRQREIAIWKTLGYRTSDLRLIFSLEAGILGLAGSLLGAGLGVLISTGLLELFRNTSTMLYQWTFSFRPPLIGVLVGTLSTVIFAFWAIVVSSQASPLALLRNEPVKVRGGQAGYSSVVLALVLAVLFTALTSMVMGSVLSGVGVLAGILIGMAILGGFFSGLLWVSVRILPLRGLPLARIAFNSLRRRGVALVFAMIALFVGVVSMSMGMAVTQVSQRKISSGAIEIQGSNLEILAAGGEENAIREVLQAQFPEKVSWGYHTTLSDLNLPGGSIGPMSAILIGRSDPQDYVLSGAEWNSQPDGVYASAGSNLQPGNRVVATFRDGSTHTFTVVGSYEIDYRGAALFPHTGLLMTAEGFTRVAQADAVNFFVQLPPAQVRSTAADLTAALPQATVVDLMAYAARFMQSYQKLYILAIALSGLALLAGILLIANSVSLAMLDRRYEIGVLKTVGYSRRHILAVFVVEYGIVSALATGAGILLIQGLLALLAMANHLPALTVLMDLPSMAVIAFCGVGLTLLTVLGVAWEPTRVSPVFVLSERN